MPFRVEILHFSTLFVAFTFFTKCELPINFVNLSKVFLTPIFPMINFWQFILFTLFSFAFLSFKPYSPFAPRAMFALENFFWRRCWNFCRWNGQIYFVLWWAVFFRHLLPGVRRVFPMPKFNSKQFQVQV